MAILIWVLDELTSSSVGVIIVGSFDTIGEIEGFIGTLVCLSVGVIAVSIIGALVGVCVGLIVGI